MADGQVGLAAARWLVEYFREDFALAVTTDANAIAQLALDAGIATCVYQNDEQLLAEMEQVGPIDLGMLVWWPKLIRRAIIEKARVGFLNTHPSLLPYNRGKHSSFWALKEQAPFGVSLHMVDERVDSGDIVAQRPVGYCWEDTAETLYGKAQTAMVELIRDTYPLIRTLDFSRTPQNLAQGSFHRAAEIDAASRIDLHTDYRARDLLNLLRARTFTGHPGCWFEDEGQIYEVRVEIRKRRANSSPVDV